MLCKTSDQTGFSETILEYMLLVVVVIVVVSASIWVNDAETTGSEADRFRNGRRDFA